MKKYAHVWFVIIAVMLSILTAPAVMAKTHQSKKQSHHHIVKKKKQYTKTQQSKKRYVAKRRTATKHRLSYPDRIETLISNNFEERKYLQSGRASWYGGSFHGKRTASGEVFNKHELTAAHQTLPLGTKVRVTNVSNGKSTIVKINDRGGFGKYDRILDVSYAAAKKLGMVKMGTCDVKVERII